MMDSGNIASGEELFNAKNRNQVLPSWGGKESEVHGSWFEEKQVEARLQDCHDLISEIRLCRKDQLALGRWISESKMVQLVHRTGSFWDHMGVETDIGQCLYPEEAMYLLETGELEIDHGGISMSIQSAQMVMFDDQYQLDQYHVYGHLSRCGCKVVRHQPHLRFTKYEKEIRLDQHQAKKRKRKLNLKDDLKELNKSLPGKISLQKSQSEVEVIDLDNQSMDDALKDFYSHLGDDACHSFETQNNMVSKSENRRASVEEITEPMSDIASDYEKKRREYMDMFPSMLGINSQMIKPEELDLFPEDSKPQKKVYRVSLEYLRYFSKYFDEDSQGSQPMWRRMPNQNRGRGNGGRWQRNNVREFHHFNSDRVWHENRRVENFQKVDGYNCNGARTYRGSIAHTGADYGKLDEMRDSLAHDRRYNDTRFSEDSRLNAEICKSSQDDGCERRSSSKKLENEQKSGKRNSNWERREFSGIGEDKSEINWKRPRFNHEGGKHNIPDQQVHNSREDLLPKWMDNKDSMDVIWKKGFSGLGNNDRSRGETPNSNHIPDFEKDVNEWEHAIHRRDEDDRRSGWHDEKIDSPYDQSIYPVEKRSRGYHHRGNRRNFSMKGNSYSSALEGRNTSEAWKSHSSERERIYASEENKRGQAQDNELDKRSWHLQRRSSKSPPHWLQHDDRCSSSYSEDDKVPSEQMPSESEIDLTMTPYWKTKRRKRKRRDQFDNYPSYLIKLPKAVHSWKEYKDIVNSMSEDSMLTQGLGASLWQGPTAPLLKPTMASTLQNVFSKCSFQLENSLSHDANLLENPLVLHFDVYLPNTVFKKSSPSIPGKRITVIRDDTVPSLDQVLEVTKRFPDEAPVVCALVNSGDVRFNTLSSVILPMPKFT